jgi:hypothetical protein
MAVWYTNDAMMTADCIKSPSHARSYNLKPQSSADANADLIDCNASAHGGCSIFLLILIPAPGVKEINTSSRAPLCFQKVCLFSRSETKSSAGMILHPCAGIIVAISL